jgi:hypothetical protein
VPKAVKIIFYIVIALFTIAYIAGWVLEVKGGNRPKNTNDDEKVALSSR